MVGSLAVVALLCGVGVVGGYGIGRGLDAVQAMLPGANPGLPADKEAPPEPIDLTGPATTCRSDALDLAVSPSSTTITVGDPLVFSVRVTNAGRVPCLFDGSDTSRTVTVTGPSSKDRVWSSGDCADDGEKLLLLGAEHVASRDLRWSSARSAPGCAKDSAALEPGTYQVRATLGDVDGATSAAVSFTVLAPEPTGEPSAEAGDKKSEDAATDEESADKESAGKDDGDEQAADVTKKTDEKAEKDGDDEG
ncbi:hypothetical protein LEP48_17310 [Isoptericola sp. NEAU-Y5]|uniref:Uncharacterized protein n=1 Tax=Isoptericola luteus TaxID=2879484 RepID=A0ABS7ZJ92_9MICO|nr:hypothetical protein [Isoptericola sp. NEAU-Y5]MCA5895091.1 hypothetical protein [Isoptericola sp. NEAU-Y5]